MADLEIFLSKEKAKKVKKTSKSNLMLYSSSSHSNNLLLCQLETSQMVLMLWIDAQIDALRIDGNPH